MAGGSIEPHDMMTTPNMATLKTLYGWVCWTLRFGKGVNDRNLSGLRRY